MPKISIILPTYNRESAIRQSIESVLTQTYRDFEMIVIDDCSTDQTEHIVKSIKDERIHYYKLEENSGASAARNTGVSYATSDIIAFQDSDDVWRADKLEKQMNYWKEHPEYKMIYCAYLLHRQNDEAVRVPLQETLGPLSGNIFSTLLVKNTIGTPTMLIDKKSFEETGGFDTTVESIEDWDFAVRFAENNEIGYLDEILVDAYQSDKGVSSRIGAYYNARCRMIAKYKDVLLLNNLFDLVVSRMFRNAEAIGILDSVQKMLMLLLQESSEQ